MGSFILRVWSKVFELLRWLSPHFLLSKCMRAVKPHWKESYRFTDSWVFAHFLGSVFLFLLLSVPSTRCLEWLAVRYGALMAFEAFVYEINLLVFEGYRLAGRPKAPGRPLGVPVLSFRRLVVTSLQNYAAIIFWFALIYRHWGDSFTPWMNIPLDPLVTWLNLSFTTMTSFGYPTVGPNDNWAVLLTLAQSAIGVVMVLLILTGFIGFLPPPFTKDRSEREEHARLT